MTIERACELINERTDYDAEIVTVSKDHGDVKGVFIRNDIKDDRSVSPIFYDDAVEDIPEDDFDTFVRFVDKTMNSSNDVDFINVLNDVEKFKESLRLCIGSHNDNDEIVKRKFVDLVQYIRIVVGGYSAKVTKVLLDKLGIDEDQAFEIAKKNMKYECMSLRQLLFGDTDEDKDSMMYVVTTDNKVMGASAMCDSDVMDKACDKFNVDEVYVIPSSIHEIIVVPVDDAIQEEQIREMIADVNNNVVSENERLSDNLYKYSKETHTVDICAA